MEIVGNGAPGLFDGDPTLALDSDQFVFLNDLAFASLTATDPLRLPPVTDVGVLTPLGNMDLAFNSDMFAGAIPHPLDAQEMSGPPVADSIADAIASGLGATGEPDTATSPDMAIMRGDPSGSSCSLAPRLIGSDLANTIAVGEVPGDGFGGSVTLVGDDSPSGSDLGSFYGSYATSAGDVNGDGFDDQIVNTYSSENGIYASSTYVVFGTGSDTSSPADFTSLDGQNGFSIATETSDIYGVSVGPAGDINGDGFADLVVNSYGYGGANAPYIVFGKGGGFAASVDGSDLDGNNGFAIDMSSLASDDSWSLAAPRDINGDGFADLQIDVGHYGGDGSYSETVYTLYGSADGFSGKIDLASLDGTVVWQSEVDGSGGDQTAGNSGWYATSAGDVNGDGFDDQIVNTYSYENGIYASSTYVVFGTASGLSSPADFTSLDGQNGFSIATETSDIYGVSVGPAGDINGDGFADLVVNSYGYGGANAPYIVFGKGGGFAASVDGSDLDGNNGFAIDMSSLASDDSWSLAAPGDINGDGFADLQIDVGHYGGDGSYSETVYTLYGSADGFNGKIDLASLDGTVVWQSGTDGSVADTGEDVSDPIGPIIAVPICVICLAAPPQSPDLIL